MSPLIRLTGELFVFAYGWASWSVPLHSTLISLRTLKNFIKTFLGTKIHSIPTSLRRLSKFCSTFLCKTKMFTKFKRKFLQDPLTDFHKNFTDIFLRSKINVGLVKVVKTKVEK